MKKVLLLLLASLPAALIAQQPFTNAIVKITMETSTDNSGGGGDGGGPVFQMAGQETEIVAYMKDSMRKVVIKNNFMNSITIYDGKTGVSTILTETMGEKTGFTQNEAQRLEQRRRSDSIMKARESEESGTGGMRVMRVGAGTDKVVDITYTEETKTINKINCKKAVLTTQNSEGVQKKTEVWYSPDYSMPAGVNIGRGGLTFSGFRGLPVMYDQVNVLNLNNSEMTMTTHYEVKSIETGKTIDDKEFTIPKGYTIKTWDEYIKENPDGPGMRRTIRFGN